MEAGNSTTKVWKNGRLQEAGRDDAALASLCQAVERAVRAHQHSTTVRAVILMIDEPEKAEAPEVTVTPVPVYVDVFDSGFTQDPGYGHGI
jgi:hypothetical protein